MSSVSEVVVLVSHFEVRPSHLLAFRAVWESAMQAIERSKPRTVASLGYVTEGGADLTIVHVFADGNATTTDIFGPDDRFRAAYEHVQPAGWEVYGPASAEVLAHLGEAALAAGVDLVIQPRAFGGFLRTTVV